ncbi:MAG: type III pantothenate kinase [Nitrospira sp.]|nr:type III pantothenate kinase [bacterium]MBL7049104.1 type III pantothenate kinase [Nitrospira sp.]
MLLLTDIGNTNITIALYGKSGVEQTLRLSTPAGEADAQEYTSILRSRFGSYLKQPLSGAVICSVVPQVTAAIKTCIRECFAIESIEVNAALKTGLVFQITAPHLLGSDRIATATGARSLYDGNLIILDFGTATTICALTAMGMYTGGAIMPGIGMSAASLQQGTAQLPAVDLSRPFTVPGKDTSENIRAGILLGQAGAVEKISSRIKSGMRGDTRIIMTGGHCGLMKEILSVDVVTPNLIFEGMKVIYELNS